MTSSLWTWRGGRLTRGLELVERDRFAQCVALGERGRGRWEELVTLDRRRPPAIAGDRIITGRLRSVELPARDGKPAKTFVVVEGGEPDGVVVRVSTAWVYTRGTAGRVAAIAGELRVVARGYGAHGAAGRIGSWDDVLITLHRGDTLRVSPEGGHKTEPWALWLDASGEPQTATEADWERLVATGELS